MAKHEVARFIAKCVWHSIQCALGSYMPTKQNVTMQREILMIRLAALTACTLVATGCQTTVNLRVDNPEKFAQEVRLVIKDDSSTRGIERALGRVDAKSFTDTTFKVKHGGTFDVIGSIPGYVAVISKSSNHYVGARPDPLDVRKTLAMDSGVTFLDDSVSMTTLSDSFKKLGPNNLDQPISLLSALNSLMGALVVVEIRKSPDPTIIYASVPPKELGVLEMTLQDVYQLLPKIREHDAVDISGKSAASVSAKLPLLNALAVGTSFTAEDIFKLSWDLENYGLTNKIEDPSKTYIDQYHTLSEARRKQLLGLLETHPEAVLMYINSLYIVNRAELKTTKAKKVGVDFSAQAAVVDANGVYSYQNAVENHRLINDVVLSFGGEELNISVGYNVSGNSGHAPIYSVYSTKKTQTIDGGLMVKDPLLKLEPASDLGPQ